jgi:RNA polymerase sigma-70 factor (ECF subfamily)
VAVAEFAQVVAAARAGDEHAFGLLWRATNPGLRRYLCVVAPGRAERVAAQVWPELVRLLRRFDGTESQWRAQAFAVARRAARRADEPGMAAVARASRTLDEAVTDVALELVAALPPVEAEAVVLRAAGNLSIVQTGEVMKLGHASVRSAAQSGLARAGMFASAPAYRDRIERREPTTEPADWYRAGFGTDLGTVDSAFERLLNGQPVRPGAPRQIRLCATVVAALAGPPTQAELLGCAPAYAAFRRQFASGPRHTRRSLRLGSRAVAVAAAASIGLSGTLVAAYSGALPTRLQDVAHEWLDAPPAKGAGDRPADRPPGPSSGSTGTQPARPVVPATGRPAGRGAGRSGRAPRPGSSATSHGPTAGRPAPGLTPPGSTRTPPGSTKTPPGSSKTPPGSSKTPPGSSKTPPGRKKSASGSAKTAPGSTRSPTHPASSPRASKTRPNARQSR